MEFLTVEEGVFLFNEAPLTELMYVGDELRKKQVPHGKVTWQIDRNVNTTNVCIANCKLCNFYRIPGHPDAYITDIQHTEKKLKRPLLTVGINCFCKADIIPGSDYLFIPTCSAS